MTIIDCPKVIEHIKYLRNFCEKVADLSNGLKNSVVDLAGRWGDEVYDRVCDTAQAIFVSLVSVDNQLLNEADDLQERVARTYNEYFERDCPFIPSANDVKIGVGALDGITRGLRDIVNVTYSDLYNLAADVKNYSIKVGSELSDLEKAQRLFADFYQTPRYDELCAAVFAAKKDMEELLEELDLLGNEVAKKGYFIERNYAGGGNG